MSRERAKSAVRGWLLGGLLAVSISSSNGQVPSIQGVLDESLSDVLRDSVGLGTLLGRPPLATDIGDAGSGFPVLDGYEPLEPQPLGSMPRGPNGGFLIRPGTFRGLLESYCLRPGTFGPGGGDGYLSASYRGPQADIVSAVLRRSSAHPRIGQHEIQMLLWAILSRSGIQDLSAESRWTAAQLLTPEEVFHLNGGALGLVPRDRLPEIFRRMPSDARRVFQAEEDMRRLLSGGENRFAPLERLAVLSGQAPWGSGSLRVPSGRWSYHRDGYFVSYEPRQYSSTTVQVLYPGHSTVQRDERGRIAAVAEQDGEELRIAYQDSLSTGSEHRSRELRAYTVRSLELHRGSEEGDQLNLEGIPMWTWVGRPSERLDENSSGGIALPGWRERLAETVASEREMGEFLSRHSLPNLEEGPQNDLRDLIHLRNALETFRQRDRGSPLLDRCVDLLQRAVASGTVRSLSGERGTQALREVEYDPSSHLAVPGNTSRQRLGLSARLK